MNRLGAIYRSTLWCPRVALYKLDQSIWQLDNSIICQWQIHRSVNIAASVLHFCFIFQRFLLLLAGNPAAGADSQPCDLSAAPLNRSVCAVRRSPHPRVRFQTVGTAGSPSLLHQKTAAETGSADTDAETPEIISWLTLTLVLQWLHVCVLCVFMFKPRRSRSPLLPGCVCPAAPTCHLNDFCFCLSRSLLWRGEPAARLHVPGEKPLATGGRKRCYETVQARGRMRSSAQRCLDMTSALFLNTPFIRIKLWTHLTATDI